MRHWSLERCNCNVAPAILLHMWRIRLLYGALLVGKMLPRSWIAFIKSAPDQNVGGSAIQLLLAVESAPWQSPFPENDRWRISAQYLSNSAVEWRWASNFARRFSPKTEEKEKRKRAMPQAETSIKEKVESSGRYFLKDIYAAAISTRSSVRPLNTEYPRSRRLYHQGCWTLIARGFSYTGFDISYRQKLSLQTDHDISCGPLASEKRLFSECLEDAQRW